MSQHPDRKELALRFVEASMDLLKEELPTKMANKTAEEIDAILRDELPRWNDKVQAFIQSIFIEAGNN